MIGNIAFHFLVPEVGLSESRVIKLVDGAREVDTLALVELYCIDPKCDCRRVIIQVLGLERDDGPPEPVMIIHGLDGPLPGAGGERTMLDPLQAQPAGGRVVLALVKEQLEDPAYQATLDRHYGMVKAALLVPAHRIHEIMAGAGRRRPFNSTVGCPTAPQLAPLVAALAPDASRAVLGSHFEPERAAEVYLAVDGLPSLAAFVAELNEVDGVLRDEALLELRVNWEDDCATSCDFETYPGWIMLSMVVDGTEESPTPALLERVAAAFRTAHAARVPARPLTRDVPRNAFCPCGSGLKYKRCCLGKTMKE